MYDLITTIMVYLIIIVIDVTVVLLIINGLYTLIKGIQREKRLSKVKGLEILLIEWHKEKKISNEDYYLLQKEIDSSIEMTNFLYGKHLFKRMNRMLPYLLEQLDHIYDVPEKKVFENSRAYFLYNENISYIKENVY